MANNYNLAVNLAPVQAVVDAIRATDVPTLGALITTVDTVVDAIRATDIATITTAITNKAIKGNHTRVTNHTTSGSYVDLVNITDIGVLTGVMFWCVGAAGNVDMRITIDGIAYEFNTFSALATTCYWVYFEQGAAGVIFLVPSTTHIPIAAEFDTSLRIEYEASGIDIYAGAMYSVI